MRAGARARRGADPQGVPGWRRGAAGWRSDRHRHVEDARHVEKLLERRKGALGPRRKDRIAALSDACRVYLQEVARRRIDLECEVRRLTRLLAQYGEADLADGVARALAARTFGARYVRTLIDQARFARGLPEPPEPIVTGHPAADAVEVKPHELETYDALFQEAAQDPDPDRE